MRSFTTDALNALRSAEPVRRGMIRFSLLSGLVGFWDGRTDFVDGGVTYRPGGQLLEIEPIGATVGLAASGLVVRLTDIPNSDLTPDVLASIESESYIGRPVLISAAYFSASTGALLQVVRIWSGYVDRINHERRSSGRASIVANLESKALDNLKSGYRLRSPSDQQKISAGDNFLNNAAVAGAVEIRWGRE